MISELEVVASKVDLPEHGLRVRDLGTVVMVYRGGEGNEVEFMTLDGETIEVVTLLASRSVRSRSGRSRTRESFGPLDAPAGE